MSPDKPFVVDALFLRYSIAVAIQHFALTCADCYNIEQELTNMYSPLYFKSIRLRADGCQQLIISCSPMARHEIFSASVYIS